MNPAQLLAHFDRISDSPDAVARSRKFILELAVRGRLVQQDSKDEPASGLVEQMRVARTQVPSNGRAKKSARALPTISDAETPYRLPNSWEWVRLGDGLEMVNGRAFKPSDWQKEGLPIVRIQNLNNANALFNYYDESQVDSKHIIDSG